MQAQHWTTISNIFNRWKSEDSGRQDLLQYISLFCSATGTRLLFITVKPTVKPWPQLNQWQKILLTSVRPRFPFQIIKRIFPCLSLFILSLEYWTLKINAKNTSVFQNYFQPWRNALFLHHS